ncbi:UNVERIFIED_CONTAM: hypothetical protein Scaly_1790300 [Sesamum calycinum]|uniref:DUF4283 domain-containing protein n=1 Tax=Sesamum calycinum TaxID=2727403 RepID=A0AAW2NWN3_9LAMI
MHQNSLPSLSHTTHTPNPTAHVCQTTDGIDEGDDEAEANSGGELHRSEKSPDKDSIEITHRIHKEFDFNEFYDLAMKVLNGDSASLERLNSLQTLARKTSIHCQGVKCGQAFAAPNGSWSTNSDGHPTAIGRWSSNAQFNRGGGNIKLQPNPIDTIASAFLQSSRKTLQFVPPSIEKGEVIIRPSPVIVAQGSQRWHSTAVGYFLGRKPYFPHLESYVRSNWRDLQQISGTSSGFYFFRFKTRAAMEEIIEEGPWLFQGQPIVLQCWEQGMSLRRQKHTQIPVWVRLKHLPMEYWTDDGLGTVASGVGIPLYTDKITKNCSRIDYARATLHEPARITKGEHIQPVQVFVKKQLASVAGEKAELQADMQRAEADPEPSVLTAANKKLDVPLQRAAGDNSPRPVSNKGKSIVLFNPFDVLDADCPVQELETTPATEHTSSGPNISSPDLAGT